MTGTAGGLTAPDRAVAVEPLRAGYGKARAPWEGTRVSAPAFVVTDIEVDGPWPGPNSMRSFASVAVTAAGDHSGEFEAVLDPLPGAQPDPNTYAWFQTVPQAWAAATRSPRPAPAVMDDFVAWVRGLGEVRHFVASPLGFDGPLHAVRCVSRAGRERAALPRARSLPAQPGMWGHRRRSGKLFSARSATGVVRRCAAHP